MFVHYGETVLTADSATVNTKTGDVEADGNVRIESGNQLWVGEHIHYNFKTHLMRTEQFRTGPFAGVRQRRRLERQLQQPGLYRAQNICHDG